MAKKKISPRKTTTKKKAAAKSDAAKPSREVADAEERLHLAREQLRQAEEYYAEIKEKAAEQVEHLRETTLGDVVDGVFEFVKKHPAAGVMGAATIGFVLGRITRPWN